MKMKKPQSNWRWVAVQQVSNIVSSGFELQPRYYVHFRIKKTIGKGMNTPYLPARG